MATQTEYPVRLQIDYPDRPLNRLTSFFRIFTVIPIAIVLGLLEGTNYSWREGNIKYEYGWGGVGLVFLPLILMLLFRLKYPKWWYDWNLAITRFGARVGAYFLLLRDEYPSTDEEQAVHLDIDYPDAPKELNRWLPLVKWLLAIPHYIILALLAVAVFFVVVVAWFAILFTGRYPRGLFEFVVGVGRWGLRVSGYTVLLVTDRYPPFGMM